ncbi:glutaminase A [Jannaschia sp. R86511]|uniref:glutaminase A n=1 Tax=Jannaschia sp. R86511 TaxID=3093853 RepID=UPI0036D308BB
MATSARDRTSEHRKGSPDGPVHPLHARLQAVHHDLSGDTGGELRSSIPLLAEADPDLFGLALTTADGQVHQVGDSGHRFTVQSVVKPFVYALALADAGPEAVMAAVGVEPTGEPFNALVLEAETGRPPNPMVNAGAILTACLVDGETAAARKDRIRSGLSAFAGRDLDDDEQVSESEKGAGARNRALSWLMKDNGTLPYDVEDALDVYVFACSLLVDARDLSVMGATLAAGGRNPVTGEQVVDAELVPTVLSVMGTCGMYDGAGGWFVKVGLPAKSGVAGGMVAVQPGQLALGTYSPPLDEHGNSVRGFKACTRLSEELGMHEFRPGGRGLPVTVRLDGPDARSSAGRTSEEEDVLAAHCSRLHLVRLQGPLTLLTADSACTALLEAAKGWEAPHWLTVDLSPIGWLHPPAVDLLQEAVDSLVDSDVHVRLVDRVRENRRPWEGATPDDTLDDLDAALRSAEDELLARLG